MQRRQFLSFGFKAACAGGVAGLATGTALAEERLSESDQMAQALGYKDDASRVDKSKTNYVAGSACANCTLYQGKPADATGECPIFRKLVSAKGWCNSYVVKA